jgi:hypothetical protein
VISVALSLGSLLTACGVVELKADNLWGLAYIALGSFLLGIYHAAKDE